MEEAEQCCTACTTTELRAEDDGLCAPCRRLRCCDSDRSTYATTSMSVAGDGEIPRSGGMNRRRTTRSNETHGCAAASVVRWSYSTARSGMSSGNKRSWPLLVLPLMMLMIITATTAAGNATSSSAVALGTTINSAKDGVCQSIDIRNKISEYSKLNGCRVIEGFVQILLIDEGDANAYENIVFPDLVEITGYILLYRVYGLKSIGSLFPNLAVIRGHQLFINYALVAFEMQNLQEVGLHSLTDISRGSVRFEKNPNLCYADTIEWDLIAKSGKEEHVISLKPLYTPDYYRELKLIRDFLGLDIEGALEKSNKPENECHVCDENCPPKPTDPDDKLCWNKQHCQKVCPKCGDRACQPSGECCHPNCLGGCTGPTDSDCTVCRDFTVNNSRCVVTCPEDTYEFLQRRCITQQECRMMRRPREQSTEMHDYPYKPFGNQCILECPAGYEEKSNKDMLSCEECTGPCFKECPGIMVDSRAAAQKLRGCTRIKGNLEIAIREGQIFVRDLEENLKDIEVITGYLKIFRSFPLVSLSFLSNLTEVQGQELNMKDYTIVVLANQNLQELWNWTTRPPLKLGSKNGVPKVSFHFNPKLCPQKIEELRQRTGLQPFSEVEVSSSSNGDKVACNVTELKSVVTSLSSKAAYITWEPFKHHDLRTLLGYFIYWKEAPTQNVGMYDGRDACGGDGWMVDDIYVKESEKSASIAANENLEQSSTDEQAAKANNSDPYSTYTQKTILFSLKPFTQYAYYVKTYTISIERSGAQSKLQYFMTLPGQPSAVRALNVYSNSSDSLVITWQPPLEPNSNLTHYMIIGVLEPYDVDYLKQRNYCDRPFRQRGHKPIEILSIDDDKQHPEQNSETQLMPKQPKEPKESKESQDSGMTTDAKGCSCPKREPEQTEKDVYSSIAFEDALHNQVYVKRGNSRRRRDIEDSEDIMSLMLETVRMKRSVNTLLGEKDVMSDGKTPLKDEPSKELAVPRDPDAPQESEGDVPTKKPQTSKYNIEDERVNNAYTRFKRNVPATEKIFVMRELQHFGKYNIIVMACRDKDANPLENECSTESMKSMQTLKLNNADNIPADSFRLEKLPGNDSSIMVKLHWAKPVNPNGVVIAYSIEFKSGTSRSQSICVTPDEFLAEGNASILPKLLPGNYSVNVRALTFASTGEPTPTLNFDVPESALAMPLWKVMVITVVILGLLICGCMCAFYFFKKKFMRNVPSMRLIATVNPEYVSTVYIPDEWEVPRKKIQLLKELGNGSFGMVYEGIAKDVLKGKPEIRCAVKTVNENATDRERIEFLNEASVMKGFNTHHVVKLLGVVSQGQPTLVVMELMEKGDLKTYLRSHRPDVCENFSQQPPTLKRILQMAIEIADGMAYLAAKKFVHRDLAARNCMVCDDLTVKIGDFGMTRDIYETDYYRKGTKGLLPVRWMAPESLKDGVFTSFSDVWSYGVVLWEMVTLASQPYQGLSNDQVLRYVIDGGVMETLENCPDSMYELMRQTWNHKATKRPTFLDIEAMLLTEIDVESFKRVSFYHSPEGVEARTQNSSQYFRNDKDLELVTLQDLREEEAEDEEDSPLRQDFGDFSSFDPVNSMENGSSGHFGMEPFADNSKPVGAIGFLELNSSKAPLKAGFDDFDGVSAGSLASSKDTLNLPFAEDSVKSVRNSPYTQKKSSSRGNVSQSSAGRSSLSPQSPSVLAASSNPGSSNVSLFKSNRPSPSLIADNHSDPEYENHSPEAVELHTQTQPTPQQVPSSSRDVTGIRVSFPSMDAIDSDVEAGTAVPTKMVLSQLDANSRSDLSSLTSANKTNATKTNDSSQQQQQQQQQQSSQQPQQQQSSQQQQQPTATSLNNGYIGGAAT